MPLGYTVVHPVNVFILGSNFRQFNVRNIVTQERHENCRPVFTKPRIAAVENPSQVCRHQLPVETTRCLGQQGLLQLRHSFLRPLGWKGRTISDAMYSQVYDSVSVHTDSWELYIYIFRSFKSLIHMNFRPCMTRMTLFPEHVGWMARSRLSRWNTWRCHWPWCLCWCSVAWRDSASWDSQSYPTG